jgi:hypothetical protein
VCGIWTGAVSRQGEHDASVYTCVNLHGEQACRWMKDPCAGVWIRTHVRVGAYATQMWSDPRVLRGRMGVAVVVHTDRVLLVPEHARGLFINKKDGRLQDVDGVTHRAVHRQGERSESKLVRLCNDRHSVDCQHVISWLDSCSERWPVLDHSRDSQAWYTSSILRRALLSVSFPS